MGDEWSPDTIEQRSSEQTSRVLNEDGGEVTGIRRLRQFVMMGHSEQRGQKRQKKRQLIRNAHPAIAVKPWTVALSPQFVALSLHFDHQEKK